MEASMDFADQIKGFIQTIIKVKPNVLTEEATKQSMVIPLLQILGYDVFNPTEVIPEFIADFGIKKGEKVDYAIVVNNEPLILVEVKHWDVSLVPHTSQLVRYFTTTKAKFAILTNGIQYQFFTDLDDKNLMDERPFLTVNLTPDIRDSELVEFKKFHKSYFDVESVRSSAALLRYASDLKNYLSAQLTDPNDEFAKFVIRQIYSGRIMSTILENFKPIIKKAVNQIVTEMVSDRLKVALSEAEQTEKETAQPEEPKPKIITTEEEIEAFHIIRAILRQFVPAEKIEYKDTQSYFVVLFEGSSWKWICRLYLTKTAKQIGFRLADGSMEKVIIDNLNEIYNLTDKLKSSLEAAVGKVNLS
jgi:hypothetical protein